MPALIFDSADRSELLLVTQSDRWIVACLCADWCDVCKQYQPAFHRLADKHPEACFAWIDVEDHADIVGDLEVENFPTLLIQRGNVVHFFGAVLPDAGIAERLLAAYREESEGGAGQASAINPLHAHWQETCNLGKLLA